MDKALIKAVEALVVEQAETNRHLTTISNHLLVLAERTTTEVSIDTETFNMLDGLLSRIADAAESRNA